jgi:hypothetical protein
MVRRLRDKAKRILMVSWRAISVFLDQATTQGSRSTILRPLQWTTLLLSLALIGALKYHAPSWLLIALFIVLLLPVIALLIAFFYCLLSGKKPLLEALRTEHYSIQKLAIEKSFRGDSDRGVIVVAPGSEPSGPLERVENQSEN